MKQYNYIVDDIQGMETYLKSLEIKNNIRSSKAILIQVFILQKDYMFIEKLVKSIKSLIPEAIIVGATTAGHISSGKTVNNKASIAISFFEKTSLRVFELTCKKGNEKEVGNELVHKIMSSEENIAGVLLLSTPSNTETTKILNEMNKNIKDFPVFGGGAVSDANSSNAFIFNDSNVMEQGIISVVFLSDDLMIETHTYTGWEALSREMRVTEIKNNVTVKEINNQPAFSVYEKYLGIKNDEYFFDNVLEFPLILERDGKQIARTSIGCDSDGSIHFLSEVKKGERIRLSYGNPDSIIKNARDIQRTMQKFNPESIFLYSCMNRKKLMKKDIQLETQPFENIAPTAGFYTYGEFYGENSNIDLLNSTIVAMGISENKNNSKISSEINYDFEREDSGKKSLVTRLGHFIKTVSSELEETNKELQESSYTDSLTQVYNRGKIGEIFMTEITKSSENNSDLSIVLLDIDKFKEINDKFGHHIGDKVLEEFGQVLKNNIRKSDAIGRWGGEEFMIVLPYTNKKEAIEISERIRAIIENTEFFKVGNVTASFGVTTVGTYEDSMQAFIRVDKALYEAKRSGRNRVVYKEFT